MPHTLCPPNGSGRSPACGDQLPPEASCQLNETEFAKFSRLIHSTSGITLPPAKRTMLSARLRKRVRSLGLSSFKEYLDYLLNVDGLQNELVAMLDEVSTNKTDFFREPTHFEILAARVLPEFLRRRNELPQGKLRIWSAGCSTGEEPYTLAMVVDEFCTRFPGLNFSILATDLSTQVLATAQRGIYPEQKIEEIPLYYRRKYLMRGTGKHQGSYRVAPELRKKVHFHRLNFIDGHFALKHQLQIIFCRNVLIYFDRPTQVSLFKKFYAKLAPGGYLFIGHSETLDGINDRMEHVAATLYRKKE